MDLQFLSTQELFSIYSGLMDEFKRRGICRSMNNPIADYAEGLVAQALDAEIQPQSTAGYDLLCKDGIRYQVKARRPTRDNPSRQLSFLRDMTERKFDFLVGVLFNEDYTVQRAAIIPWEIVSAYATYRKNQHAWIFHLEDRIWELPGVKELTLSGVPLPNLPACPPEQGKAIQASERSCLCGCGEVPSGRKSNFVMGHDAKLKSRILKNDPNLTEKGLEYARAHWPELFSNKQDSLLEYLKRNLDMFQTKPQIQEIHGHKVSFWRSTRLQLMRDGIEPLSDPSSVIAQYIEPKNGDYGYVGGVFIIKLGELENIPRLQGKRQSTDYVSKGFYNWPNLPKDVERYFYPL